MFETEEPRSFLDDAQWWEWLNTASLTPESTRYAFSLFLQTFSAPTSELRLQALSQALSVGVPASILAEEAILNDQSEILKTLKIQSQKPWRAWDREAPVLSKEHLAPRDLENYGLSIQNTPLLIQWILEYACFKKDDSQCLKMILNDKQDRWSPIEPLPLHWHTHGSNLNIHPTQESWTPLAYALIHQNFKTAQVLLQDNRVSKDQQSLDEALFVLCGLKPGTKKEDKCIKDALILTLLKAGANPARAFECHFRRPTSESSEDWTWSVCAGLEMTQAALIQQTTKPHSFWKEIEPYLHPESWSVSMGPVKEPWKSSLDTVFATLKQVNEKKGYEGCVNFEALTKLAKAPYPYAHENFIGETLLSLLSPNMGESKEKKIQALQSLHDKIGQPQFYSHDAIWNEVLKRINLKTTEMLDWAKAFTGQTPSLQTISFHWNPKNLKEVMNIDWSNILTPDEMVLFHEIKAQFHGTIEPILSSTNDESQEKVQLFLSTLPLDRALPKPKSLRM